MALHFKQSPETLDQEAVKDYLFHCKSLHQTPSESFFKYTVYGLRATYKVLGIQNKRIALPQIKASRSKVATNKKFTAHTLRHSYATHLLEEGVNIMQLKLLLGHACIENTIKYLHVCQVESTRPYSPLDTLFL